MHYKCMTLFINMNLTISIIHRNESVVNPSLYNAIEKDINTFILCLKSFLASNISSRSIINLSWLVMPLKHDELVKPTLNATET